MPRPYTPFDLALSKQGLKPASIGDYRFWVNPQAFSMTTAPVYVHVVTLGGVGRMSFGHQAYQYTLSGFTGNGGLEELDQPTKGDTAMRSFRPLFGKKDQIYRFSFPARGLLNRPVYVDNFQDSMRSGNGDELYHFYEIQLSELPPSSTATRGSLQPGVNTPNAPY